MIGQFGEDAVKVFAAELGSALGKSFKVVSFTVGKQCFYLFCCCLFVLHIAGFLHDFGIIHRDVKVNTLGFFSCIMTYNESKERI